MAKAEFVLSAKHNIYKRGRKVEYVSKRGKRAGQTLTKIDRNQPADEGDEVLIHTGESYYTWCFYGGQPIYSKTKPRPSQLTQNSFKQELYSIQEEIEDFDPCCDTESISSFVEDITGRLEDLRDTCQESFENIPEQLQEAPAGETLQERIDNLESAIAYFENIDTEFESELKRTDETDDEWEEKLSDEKYEWCANKLSEIQEIDLSFE